MGRGDIPAALIMTLCATEAPGICISSKSKGEVGSVQGPRGRRQMFYLPCLVHVRRDESGQKKKTIGTTLCQVSSNNLIRGVHRPPGPSAEAEVTKYFFADGTK